MDTCKISHEFFGKICSHVPIGADDTQRGFTARLKMSRRPHFDDRREALL
jgi:hypothetical protein